MAFVSYDDIDDLYDRYKQLRSELPEKYQVILPPDLKSFLMEERSGLLWVANEIAEEYDGWMVTEAALKKIETLKSEHAAALIRAYAVQLAQTTELP